MQEQQKQTSELTYGLTFTQKIGMVAASVSSLYLLPSGANAAIVYHNTPLTISNSHTLGFENGISWDVDGNSVEEFRLWKNLYFDTVENKSVAFLNLFNNSSAFFVFRTSAGSNRYYEFQIENLPQSFQVGLTLAANYSFGGQSSFRSVISSRDSSPEFAVPNFLNKQDSYLGFKFTKDGQTHYGWATLYIDWNSPTDFSYTIKEWAYNSRANESIHVADKASIPEPSSPLALLALGAAGVYRWRKHRKSVQNKEDRAA